jgi:hypothetical protein
VERSDGTGPFFFANRVINADTASTTFAAARKDLAMEFLRRLDVLPESAGRKP